MRGVFVGIVLFAAVVSSGSAAQQSLRDLESAGQFQRAMAAVEAIKLRKKVQCVLAISNGALCQCLARTLALNTYIRSYAAITDQERRGPEYAQLPAADKEAVDRCVNDSR